MVIVAGHVMVDPAQRDEYLAACVEVVRQARAASGCVDFALSADLVDPGRVNILERWDSQPAVEAFREGQGDGPGFDKGALIVSGSVTEFDVAGQRTLMS